MIWVLALKIGHIDFIKKQYNISGIVADFKNLPKELDGKFDCVVANGSLEHLGFIEDVNNNTLNQNQEFSNFTDIHIGNISPNTEINSINNIHQSQIWLGNALHLRFQKRNSITYDILKEHTIGISEIYNIKKNSTVFIRRSWLASAKSPSSRA